MSQTRKKAMQQSKEEELPEHLKMYITENKVRDIVAEILKPVIQKSYEDFDFSKSLYDRLKLQDDINMENNKKFRDLETLISKVDDVQRLIAKNRMEASD